jgi:hypothetical protein
LGYHSDTLNSTYDPLDPIARDKHVSCVEIANTNRLLDTPGWKIY